jgi:hypothetical protein
MRVLVRKLPIAVVDLADEKLGTIQALVRSTEGDVERQFNNKDGVIVVPTAVISPDPMAESMGRHSFSLRFLVVEPAPLDIGDAIKEQSNIDMVTGTVGVRQLILQLGHECASCPRLSARHRKTTLTHANQ